MEVAANTFLATATSRHRALRGRSQQSHGHLSTPDQAHEQRPNMSPTQCGQSTLDYKPSEGWLRGKAHSHFTSEADPGSQQPSYVREATPQSGQKCTIEMDNQVLLGSCKKLAL